jgi:hypothetical protein
MRGEENKADVRYGGKFGDRIHADVDINSAVPSRDNDDPK